MEAELPKPWMDLESYAAARRREAEAEALVALSLLREGLHRNAAGKAFQAFKSLLAALAAERRDLLLREFPGQRRLDRWTVAAADVVIAFMSTGSLRRVAALMGLEEDAKTALALHQYQYNGVDPEGLMSIYSRRDEVARDLCALLRKIGEILGSRELREACCPTS